MSISVHAQHTITGSFPPLAGQQVRLVGFEGLGTYVIDSTKVSEQGVFKLRYTGKDRGMGFLTASDSKACFVVLANENIVLKGELLSIPESVMCAEGDENKWFVQYAIEQPRRQQALSAWDFLQKKYTTDSLFLIHQEPVSAIGKEIHRIQDEDTRFLSALDKKSYISWFLPVRKLVGSVSQIAQYKTEHIPATLAAFRSMDYTDQRFWKSGLYRDALEGHYWLIENSGQPLDSVFKAMNVSTDYLIASLSKDEEKFNIVTNYLFGLLEKHSLFEAAEYLSVKVLTQNSCTLTDNLTRQLETYRAMKKGNIAPDIFFNGDHLTYSFASESLPKKLSDIKSKYIVVIFGASWCPKCTEELPEISGLYGKWKGKGIEVVFVSLDENKENHNNFVKDFPFITTCDFQKWNSKIVKDYYVFATPTMYLLDAKREIVLRPSSVKQLDTWVDWTFK
jgi:thiol-disulfide isomerase/thioredoxin